jgi:DNA repair protein REV1
MTRPQPLPVSRSSSSDYFERDDPQFLDNLLHMKLPGDASSSKSSQGSTSRDIEKHSQRSLKRSRSPSFPLTQTEPSPGADGYMEPDADEEDTYGASRFGGWGEYMRRKRAKLQIQNSQLDATSGIFQGLAIYVSFPVTSSSLHSH